MWEVKTTYCGHEDPAEDSQESHERFENAAQAEAQFCMRAKAVGVSDENAAAALVARTDQESPATVSAQGGAVLLTFRA